MHSFLRTGALVGVLSSLSVSAFLATPVAQAKPRPYFSIPSLASFDGQRWGDLQLGVTTFKDIKKSYETGDGMYTDSTELSQTKDAPIRVDLGWKKRGGEEVLSFIAVRYKNTSPSEDELAKALAPVPATPDSPAAMGENLYLPGRYEEWRLIRYTGKGAVVFQNKIGDLVNSPLVVFSTPSALATVTQKLSPEYSDPVPYIDPHAGEEKVMLFGTVDLDADGLDDDLRIPYRTRDDVASDLQYATAGGTIRYSYNGTGSYTLDVSGRGSLRKGGSFTATANISGNGPYGPISSSSSDTESWDASKKERRYDNSIEEAFRDAVRSARRSAESDFQRKMEKSGPPTLGMLKADQWKEIIETMRKYSGI